MSERLDNVTSDSMFDILMEIRQVDKQISQQRLQVQISQEELLTLEKNILKTKDLQLKASIILNEAERVSQETTGKLKNIHKTFDSVIELLGEHFEIVPDGHPEYTENDIEKMKEKRDNLKGRLSNIQKEQENLARKLNDIDLQVTIQKKKNAATLLRLQKNLEESLQEEKNLMEQLRSTNNI